MQTTLQTTSRRRSLREDENIEGVGAIPSYPNGCSMTRRQPAGAGKQNPPPSEGMYWLPEVLISLFLRRRWKMRSSNPSRLLTLFRSRAFPGLAPCEAASTEVVHIQPTSKNNFAIASFLLHVPRKVRKPRYILVLVPGLNGDGGWLLRESVFELWSKLDTGMLKYSEQEDSPHKE